MSTLPSDRADVQVSVRSSPQMSIKQTKKKVSSHSALVLEHTWSTQFAQCPAEEATHRSRCDWMGRKCRYTRQEAPGSRCRLEKSLSAEFDNEKRSSDASSSVGCTRGHAKTGGTQEDTWMHALSYYRTSCSLVRHSISWQRCLTV